MVSLWLGARETSVIPKRNKSHNGIFSMQLCLFINVYGLKALVLFVQLSKPLETVQNCANGTRADLNACFRLFHSPSLLHRHQMQELIHLRREINGRQCKRRHPSQCGDFTLRARYVQDAVTGSDLEQMHNVLTILPFTHFSPVVEARVGLFVKVLGTLKNVQGSTSS